MPKISRKPVKGYKPKTKPKPLPEPIDPAEALAAAADREGMLAIDLINFPELLLQRYKIAHEDAGHGTAIRADKLNRERINELLAKYNNPKPSYAGGY